jgi:hypothetical protein
VKQLIAERFAVIAEWQAALIGFSLMGSAQGSYTHIQDLLGQRQLGMGHPAGNSQTWCVCVP